ncbi:IclR family transcriptional regulator [Hyphomonas johnsonii MHS-2]|uniref:IclR family transcriptional regulator n=2 Tax=Hyphomonas johnsonii TaxID=81031 RepID=A0A059FE12_9PROT|nr:IclR family transcriptional regulator [Hyphomonas johnsonii MHS-2]
MQIFDFFDEVGREAKASEIGGRLNFPQSSTSVLLNSLVEMGFLDYEERTRTFLPSPRIALLGSRLGAGPMRDGRVIRIMEALADRTGETIILAIRNGPYALDVKVIQGKQPNAIIIPQGQRRLAVRSAAGLALLKDEPDALIAALCRRANAESNDDTRIDLNQVRADLEYTRTYGYFFSRELAVGGVGAIAVPLQTGLDGGSRKFAIAVSGQVQEIALREADIVKAIKDEITSGLLPEQSPGV